jgi:hypothetical protein
MMETALIFGNEVTYKTPTNAPKQGRRRIKI